jgi:endoribonuclease L-PSP, putative
MKQIIMTNDAPAAIGPYSQGIKAGGFIYLSGQIPLDPKTGEIVAGGIEQQTAQVLDNISALLAAEGAAPEDIIKTTVFLKNIGDFAAMNDVYANYFGTEGCPVRSTIEVAALPKGALVEIEAVAFMG